MATSRELNKAFLLRNAVEIVARLKANSRTTGIRVRKPFMTNSMDTDGWSVAIGYWGNNGHRLELWLDRFSGLPNRKLYAGFFFPRGLSPNSWTKRIGKHLWPVRTVADADTIGGQRLILANPLKSEEFRSPIMERFRNGPSYYGIYDSTRGKGPVDFSFCSKSVGFFEDVVSALPRSKSIERQLDAYPKFENRRLVASHVQRERNGLLAANRKIHDKYKCQVCKFDFHHVYGPLGFEFAEAHHKVPLSKLRRQVQTEMDDLVTVCANCHRMLHRMNGQADDVETLKQIVKKNR